MNETKDRLSMACSVRWYVHVLRREDGHALRRALDFEVKRRKADQTAYEKRQVEEESVKVFWEDHQDALCRSKWSVDVNLISVGLR